MTFGIDYDNTWTADPQFFRELVKLLLRHGHQAVIVTNRGKDTLPIEEVLPLKVVYTGGVPKRLAAQSAGHQVDIWVDDLPHLVDFGAGHQVCRALGLP